MYTKGKWEISEYRNGDIWVGADYHIATVFGNTERKQGNAQRICKCVNGWDELEAINKDLLEACEELISSLDNCPGIFNYSPKIEDKLQQAIARAKGEL